MAAQSQPHDVCVAFTPARRVATSRPSARISTVRKVCLSRTPSPKTLIEPAHTLSGSSKHLSRRAALASLVAPRIQQRPGTANQDLSLLSDCMLAMEAVVTHLDEVTGYFTAMMLMDRNRPGREVDERVAQVSEQQA